MKEQTPTISSYPKMVGESELKLSDNISVTVCVLENGKRIIPENEMPKVLAFLKGANIDTRIAKEIVEQTITKANEQ